MNSKLPVFTLFLLLTFSSKAQEVGVYKNTYNSGMAKVERLDQIEGFLEKMSKDYQKLVNEEFKKIEQRISELEEGKDKKKLTNSTPNTDLESIKVALSNEFDRKLDRLSQRLDEEVEKERKKTDEQIVKLLERIVALEKSILDLGTIKR